MNGSERSKERERELRRLLSDSEGLRPSPTLVIGEVAQAHDGSLGTAHAYIDAIAGAGADAVKFQTHIAEAESSPDEPWRVRFSPQDDTRFDYWKRMEFTEDQWTGLKEHAEAKGLIFLSSPFSHSAADLLERLNVAAWKIASGEVASTTLVERIARTGLPVLMSSGMSSLAELDVAVEILEKHACPMAVMQCTSMYPTPPQKVGLNLLPIYRERYGCAVGLSDHSGTIWPSVVAATMGAAVVEVHVTLSRESFGPDVVASVTTKELASLVEGLRFVNAMLTAPVKKDRMAEELGPIRRLFTKSVVARRALEAGAVISKDDLTTRKPGTGIPESDVEKLVGRRLRRPLEAGEMLDLHDLD